MSIIRPFISTLEYSIANDAAFCFYCRIFAANDSNKKGSTDEAYILNGFSAWNKAPGAFGAHDRTQCHQTSLQSYNEFMNNTPIDIVLDIANAIELKKKEQQRIKNRKYMATLIDIVITLSKGGRPFRGHDKKETSSERGLFLKVVELLKR